MNEQQILSYIAMGSAILQAGGTLVGTLKGVLELIKPNHGLTDEQINAIERASVADSELRKQQRIAMGQLSS